MVTNIGNFKKLKIEFCFIMRIVFVIVEKKHCSVLRWTVVILTRFGLIVRMPLGINPLCERIVWL